MKFKELSEILFAGLEKSIQSHKSLNIFVSNRSKFEGWLKVVTTEILVRHSCRNVLPEQDHIDVVFDDWALELKTCNTNYRYGNVVDKPRPITMNIQGIVDDIKSLEKKNYENKAILFVVFPLESGHVKWPQHLEKISGKVKDITQRNSRTENGIPIVMYMVQI